MWMMHGLRGDSAVLEEAMDFAGADIDSLYGVETAVQCRRACEEHSKCLAFTYVRTEKACWLKGEGYSAKSNPNTISGGINTSLASARLSALNRTRHRRRGRRMQWEDQGELSTDELAGIEDDDEAGKYPVFEGEYPNEGPTYDADEPRTWDGEREEGAYDEDGTPGDLDENPLPRVVLSEEDAAKYNDSTSFLGDVRLLRDLRVPADCEDACLAHGRCVAWSLDKVHYACLLRLINTSALRYDADYVGARLTAEQIGERSRRLEREAQRQAAEAKAAEERRAERRSAAAERRAAANATNIDTKAARAAAKAARAAANLEAATGVSNSSSSGGGGSASSSAGGSSAGSSSVGSSSSSSEDQEDDEDEEGLEMHSEISELDGPDDEDVGVDGDDTLRNLGGGGTLSEAADEVDALRRVYNGLPLGVAELDEPAGRVVDEADLLGGDLRELSGVRTITDCREACAAYVPPTASNPPCEAWTLGKSSGRCWLKSAAASRQPASRSPGLISGFLVRVATPMPASQAGAAVAASHASAATVAGNASAAKQSSSLVAPPLKAKKMKTKAPSPVPVAVLNASV